MSPTRPSPTLTRTVLEASPRRKQGLRHTRMASRRRARSRAWKRRWRPRVCHVSMRPAADHRNRVREEIPRKSAAAETGYHRRRRGSSSGWRSRHRTRRSWFRRRVAIRLRTSSGKGRPGTCWRCCRSRLCFRTSLPWVARRIPAAHGTRRTRAAGSGNASMAPSLPSGQPSAHCYFLPRFPSSPGGRAGSDTLNMSMPIGRLGSARLTWR